MNGKRAETLAVWFLRFRGYHILDRNYRSRFGEIDIIAQKSDSLIFVEVKARGENAVAPPASAVDVYKQKKIIKTAQFYILHENKTDCDISFDVVEIFKIKGRLKINHIKNAFGV